MSVEKRTATFSGHTWSINTMSASRGLPILGWLGTIIGDGVSRAGATDSLGGAIAGALDKLGKPETLPTIKDICKDLFCDDKPVAFDDFFAANYGTLAAVVHWILEENFRSFFDGNPLIQRVKEALEKLTKALPSS